MEVLPVPAGPKVIMTIFIDSAKESEGRLAKAYGWVKGVTTNPALLAQAGVSPELALQRLAAIATKTPPAITKGFGFDAVVTRTAARARFGLGWTARPAPHRVTVGERPRRRPARGAAQDLFDPLFSARPAG